MGSFVTTDVLKFIHPDPETDDFQNLMVTSLSKHTSLLKIFLKIDQKFLVKLFTDQ